MLSAADTVSTGATPMRPLPHIPVRGLVGMDGGVGGDQAYAIALGLGDERQGTTAALANDDHDLALAALVLRQTTVAAVCVLLRVR